MGKADAHATTFVATAKSAKQRRWLGGSIGCPGVTGALDQISPPIASHSIGLEDFIIWMRESWEEGSDPLEIWRGKPQIFRGLQQIEDMLRLRLAFRHLRNNVAKGRTDFPIRSHR